MSAHWSFTLILLMLLQSFSWSQVPTQLHLAVRPGSRISLNGTSTVHDYSATSPEIIDTFVVDPRLLEKGKIMFTNLFRQVTISIPVKSLHSSDEDLDNNMYEALMADDYPSIRYRLTSDSIMPGATSDSLTIKTIGQLTVAGKEKTIDMIVTVRSAGDSTFRIRGMKELLMTDFGITPPSMMMGLLKTDNKIVISFDLLTQPHNVTSQTQQKGR